MSFSSHLLIGRAQHGDIAGQAADDVGNRLGEEHAGRAQPDDGQQQRQRHDDDHLAQQGKRDGIFRPAQRLKDALAAELEALEEEAREIHAQHPHAGLDHRLVRRENPAEQPRLEHRKQPRAERVDHRRGGHEANPRPDALHLPRAVVVAEHGARAVGDAAGGQGKNVADGVDHRHHANVQVAAPAETSSTSTSYTLPLTVI